MSYIFTTSMCPSDKVAEATKKYLEAMTKFPPDASLVNRIVPAAVTTTLQGVKTITIVEVKAGKLDDAMNRTAALMAMFHSIQGFEYTIERYATLEEAMATVGM
jgi:hypothetical protein